MTSAGGVFFNFFYAAVRRSEWDLKGCLLNAAETAGMRKLLSVHGVFVRMSVTHVCHRSGSSGGSDATLRHQGANFSNTSQLKPFYTCYFATEI